MKPTDIENHENEAGIKRVENFVNSKITANLFPISKTNTPHSLEGNLEQKSWSWLPEKQKPFNDEDDPRKIPFDCNIFQQQNEKQMNTQYRNLQLATQFHRCTFTCFKYNKASNEKRCRFNYPVEKNSIPNPETTTIIHEKDRNGRRRTRVIPPRNNSYINPTFSDTLIPIASGGNVDIQYLSNTMGCVEYTTSYMTKQEQADSKVIENLFIRKLLNYQKFSTNDQKETDQEGITTDRNVLKAAGLAFTLSEKIGTVQACNFLLQLPFITSSRKTQKSQSITKRSA